MSAPAARCAPPAQPRTLAAAALAAGCYSLLLRTGSALSTTSLTSQRLGHHAAAGAVRGRRVVSHRAQTAGVHRLEPGGVRAQHQQSGEVTSALGPVGGQVTIGAVGPAQQQPAEQPQAGPLLPAWIAASVHPPGTDVQCYLSGTVPC